jgi:hypothetical protein
LYLCRLACKSRFSVRALTFFLTAHETPKPLAAYCAALV